MGQVCTLVWRDGGWCALSEPSGNGDCAQVEIPCGEGEDEGDTVVLAHQEVYSEGLLEALVDLSLNESNESSWHVLLHRRLCL